MDLSMTAYWKIRARLLRVPGVANVPIWGERLEMLQVRADPERLRQNKVTLEQVMTATSDALDAGLATYSDGNFIGTGGWLDTPQQRLSVEAADDNTRTISDTSLSVRLYNALQMKVGMRLQNDSDVAPDKESTDTTTYINLVYRY
jgi:multidrug efflux pump subunit AcrB